MTATTLTSPPRTSPPVAVARCSACRTVQPAESLEPIPTDRNGRLRCKDEGPCIARFTLQQKVVIK